MVIEIDTQYDSPEEIFDKVRSARNEAIAEAIEKRREAKRAAFGKVKWDEDAVAYQKRLRDEWD